MNYYEPFLNRQGANLQVSCIHKEGSGQDEHLEGFFKKKYLAVRSKRSSLPHITL